MSQSIGCDQGVGGDDEGEEAYYGEGGDEDGGESRNSSLHQFAGGVGNREKC